MKNLRFTTKLLMGAAVAVALSVSTTSCSDDDDDEEDVAPTTTTTGGGSSVAIAPIKVISSNISGNVSWSNDTVYELAGRIVVLNGAQLTIEKGTVVKGQPGQQASAKALIVARGGKIFANGTAAEPIIMTTTLDQFQPGHITIGQLASPNLDSDVQGQWGGLIVLGNARVSTGNSSGSFDVKQIEGIPPTDPNGEYGGNQDTDNSGSITYVSIRHGGTNIGDGNEINGLTLGGVGSGTTINNIEIVANKDDGIEFFGGTVSITDVVVWNNGDDAIDTDQAWNGTISNFAVVGPTGSPFELDGPEGTYLNGNHKIMDGVVIPTRGDGAKAEDLINYDANTNADLKNLTFISVASGQEVNSQGRTTSTVTFDNILIDVDSTNLSSYVNTALHSASAIGTEINAGNTNTFDAQKLSWTWAAKAGRLAGL